MSGLLKRNRKVRNASSPYKVVPTEGFIKLKLKTKLNNLIMFIIYHLTYDYNKTVNSLFAVKLNIFMVFDKPRLVCPGWSLACVV